jgi:D-arabinose 1-dehydrogenase-like Zn-dependent alcohol dehydrogenase
LRDVPVPQPKAGEVLVRVAACGVCLSDVHLLDGSLPLGLPEVTPGHEAAGTIEEVGRGVPGWKVGDRVLLMGGKPDYTCRNCVRGLLTECLNPQLMGFHYDGAGAEYVVVPFTGLTAVPDDLPLQRTAIIADAVATPYGGLVERAGLRPGETVGL